ncbi:MAG: ABC transporter permease subunit [Traorella sp.]
MTLIKHELNQGKLSLVIWTLSIASLVAICVLLYPEMGANMEGVNDMFSNMGSFSEAFGMDQINFGTLIGFYTVECGNILGLGGALYASLLGIEALEKEQRNHTSEFLLTHPISRVKIMVDKLIAILIQLVVMNLLVLLVTVLSIMFIQEAIPWEEILWLHFAYFLLQIELAGICFGISAFLKRGGIGIGLGLSLIMYFLNIVANITDSAEFLKYITPFGFAEGADIVINLTIDIRYLLVGIVMTILFLVLGFMKYSKKDIA